MVSWNNSKRGDFYSSAYKEELNSIKKYVEKHILSGLKFMTWEEIEFLLKLKWHEDSVSFLLRDNMSPQLNYYIGGGYVTVNVHCNEEIPVNRFFNIGYKCSPPENMCTHNKFYEVEDIVRHIEILGQLAEGYAVLASENEEELGYIPNWKEDYYFSITPLTKECIERLPVKKRVQKLKEEEIDFWKLPYLLKLKKEEVYMLLYNK